MAMNSIYDTAQNAMCNALVDLIDEGTAPGVIELFEDTTLLAVLTFHATNPAFDTAPTGATPGEATADDIQNETSALATGTANICVISSSDAADTPKNTIWKGVVGTGSGDLQMTPSNSISAGNVVSISSMTVTMPDS